MSDAASGNPLRSLAENVCSYCGELLPTSAKFCGKCGKPLLKDFFISYTGVNLDRAAWVARQLEAGGYTTIYQARDFHAGGIFTLQMHKAMRSTKRTVAVLSPDYLRSRYCAPEWAEAARRDPTGEYALLLLVRVHDCQVDGMLGARVYVNLVGLDEAEAGALLLERVREIANKPMPPALVLDVDPNEWIRPFVLAPMGLPLAASLIGREHQLDGLMTRLRTGSASGLFALRGMGGVGKTALAAEAVARLAEEQAVFPGGAAWIPCEGLEGETGLDELWTRVAQALRLEQVTKADPQTRRFLLTAALTQEQPLLLALDNIEPGLDADAVLETLSVRGHTTLLLTARQPIARSRVTAMLLSPLEPSDACTLFLERLAQAGGTAPIPTEEPVLNQLMAAVGGLPLAVELTAAYAGIQQLSIASIVQEVQEDGLDAAVFRDDPKRALGVRFERSWLALSDRQRRLFAGLSLLAGVSFPRDAALAMAKAITEETDPPENGATVRSDLATLVNYALVEALPGGERLRLHPLLREYAEKKLAMPPNGQRERLGDTLAMYWLKYAENHSDFHELNLEYDHIMGALKWGSTRQQDEFIAKLCKALSEFWNNSGRSNESQSYLPLGWKAAEAIGEKKIEAKLREEYGYL